MALSQSFNSSNASVTVVKNSYYANQAIRCKPSVSIKGGHEGTVRLTQEIMNERIDWIQAETRSSHDARPFVVADIGDIWRNYQHYTQSLPRVEPHFAVKANPEETIIRLLANAGAGFDVASYPEAQQVIEGSGVDPARTIFAHPRMNHEAIIDTRKLGVKHFVYDSLNELDVAVQYFPDIKYVLRFAPDVSSAKCNLGEKFGAELEEVPELLEAAKERNIDVVGVSFHVGSDSGDPRDFSKAIKQAKEVFDAGRAMGFNFHILDIGGGYTWSHFDQQAEAIRSALDQYFPDPSIRIIGEPGRFLVSSAFTLATRVQGLKSIKKPRGAPDDFPKFKLDLGDGAYGNLNNTQADHQEKTPQILRKRDLSNDLVHYGAIWGPTCDSWDKVTKKCTLPGRLQYGDWVYFNDQGAYTNACATRFNGLPIAKMIWTSTERTATNLLNYQDQHKLYYPKGVTVA